MTAAIYDLQGRRVRTLLDEVAEAGDHRLIWDGVDDRSRAVSPGVSGARRGRPGRTARRGLASRSGP